MSAPTIATGRGHPHQIHQALLFCFLVIPLTFSGRVVFGLLPSGWAWLLILVATAPLVLVEPMRPEAIRTLVPYLLALLYALVTLAWVPEPTEGVALLVQLVIPGVVYLLAWRIVDIDRFLTRVRKISLVYIGVSIGVVLVTAGGSNSPRPLSISLIVLFVAATIRSQSWRFTVGVGGVALAIALYSGSRASSAVLLLLLMLSPSLAVGRRGRIAMVAAGVLLVGFYSQTDTFQDRFFFSDDATVRDVLTMEMSVNTAGRRELWPALLDSCGEHAVWGGGLSASSSLSNRLTSGAMPHPHNEYLRTYCEIGGLASIPFWAFFVFAAVRSWRGVFAGPDPRLHGAAGQLLLALLLLAVTDNPLTYVGHFMAPMAVLLGLSDQSLARARRRRLAEHHRPRAVLPKSEPLAPRA